MTSSLLLFAAAASVCLAAFVWLALVGARAARHAMLRRRTSGREAAAQALARFRRDGDGGALAAALNAVSTEALAALLARVLPALGEAEARAVCAVLRGIGFDGRTARALPGAGEGVRMLYCELLGETGGEAAPWALGRALGDRSARVRMAAAIALARIGAAPDLPTLLRKLGAEGRGSARLAVLLEELLPRDAGAVIRIAADPVAAPRLRLSALHALRLAEHGLYQRLLAALAEDPQPQIAVEVARSLAPAPDGAAIVAGLLGHPSHLVRREAARAAERLGAAALDPPLRRLLADRDPTAASAAARSLWAVPPGEAAPPRLQHHG
jgi:HEAT repeat protein